MTNSLRGDDPVVPFKLSQRAGAAVGVTLITPAAVPDSTPDNGVTLDFPTFSTSNG